MVAQTRTAATPSKKLTFNEKIVGKSLSTDVLLKKLKALHTELAELDQELVDVNSLSSVRSQLINTSLLLHKDRGVKAYTACCLADILRLYAPDAPYTQNELKDIFQFFFRQLSAGLKGTDAPYYNEYFHLLESLSTVKSVVLVCDLPHADELMSEIFRDFFVLVRRDLAKKIELFIADILVALIDECQSLPSEVLDTMMAQFLDKNTRLDQPAYRLAVQICNATSDKLQRHVCQYFTDTIVTNSRELDTEGDYDEIRTAHNLVKQLSKSCPSLLHSVIPQLEEELRVDQVQVRLIVTHALGEMFADKGGSDLIRKYPTTWNVWLMRKNDKAAAVRLKLVESARGLLLNLPEHRETTALTRSRIEMLQLKLLDPDEKVRAAVCKVYSQLDYETAFHSVSEAQLRAVAGRGMDKKHAVRVEAMNALGKLYSLAYPEIENGDAIAASHFAWIPNEVLHISNMTSETKAAAERVIADYVLPLPSPPSNSASTSKNVEVDEVAWTDHLLNIMQHLDDLGINTILSMSGIKANRPTMYEHYLRACIQNNGGVIDENEEIIIQRLNNVVKHLARQFPDPVKAAEDLHEFAKANENRLYKLLKTCVDPQSDLKSIVKASNEFLRRVEQSLESTLSTMTIFLRRATLRIANQSSISTLIKRVQKSAPTSKHAQQLLTFISKHCPALYKPHVSELTKAIADERNVILVEVGMHALAAVAKADESQVTLDKRALERITRFAVGENPKIAKFAARLLASLKDHEDACVEIIESISDKLPEATPEELIAYTTVLVQMARFKPVAFEHRGDTIMAFLIKKLLMGRRSNDPEEMDVDDDWVQDDELAPIQKARILALKVCRNRCLANASVENAVGLATPALKMFSTLLEHSGSFSADAPDSSQVKSRMRLQAAVSLLHLSTVEAFATVISSNFIWLAITVQDPCYHIRIIFLTKLVSLLTARKLPPRFNTIPFLTIHDPEADVRDRAIAYISFISKSIPPAARVDQLELIFIRLLHLLAHHPDFSTTHENIQEMAKYIEFYLDLIAGSENIALLYHLAMKAKTVRDSESHTYSESLYTMADLAQELIKARAQARSWTLQSYPGKVKLPSDILRALPSTDAVAKVVKTQYLSEETIDWLRVVRGHKPATATKEKKRESREARNGRSPPAKRKASRARANGAPKWTKKSARWNSDQSESEEEPSSDGESVHDQSEKATSPRRSSSVVSETGQESNKEEDGGEPSEREKKFGRKARMKAQEKMSKQIKKAPTRPRKS
ncbi:cohesin-associated protein Pds5 [Boletus edulis BED1]|uniref:Cohesin-associated protein Pds5 n=1 Tax=Boletus edulis BED1 TaxID=1328754 RepID=A0AAD4BMB2_BOLED|nr:cohesin-associated protein Pds5 [Boletus edulis BED1]